MERIQSLCLNYQNDTNYLKLLNTWCLNLYFVFKLLRFYDILNMCCCFVVTDLKFFIDVLNGL